MSPLPIPSSALLPPPSFPASLRCALEHQMLLICLGGLGGVHFGGGLVRGTRSEQLWVSARPSFALCCLQLALPSFPALFLHSVPSFCVCFSPSFLLWGGAGGGGHLSWGQLLGFSLGHVNVHIFRDTITHCERGGKWLIWQTGEKTMEVKSLFRRSLHRSFRSDFWVRKKKHFYSWFVIEMEQLQCAVAGDAEWVNGRRQMKWER